MKRPILPLTILALLLMTGVARAYYGPPPLPVGATEPPGHYAPNCDSCHVRSGYLSPVITADATEPANHYGASCISCHSIGAPPTPPTISSTATTPTPHYAGACSHCHTILSTTAPPLPAGATAPTGHYPGACSNCHTIRTAPAPPIANGVPAPAGHYGTYCAGCHAMVSATGPTLPRGAIAPPGHYAGTCTSCHGQSTRYAPSIESGEDGEEDEHPGSYWFCSGCHLGYQMPVSMSLSSAPTYVRYGHTAYLTLTMKVGPAVLGGKGVQVWKRRYPSRVWVRDYSATYRPATRTYVATRRITASTQYQMRFAGDPVYRRAASNRHFAIYWPATTAARRRVQAWINAVR